MVTEHQNNRLLFLILKILNQIFECTIGLFDQGQIFFCGLYLGALLGIGIVSVDFDVREQVFIFFAVAAVVLHGHFKGKQWLSIFFVFI